ncbi:MAG: sulfite exporter TauE/SafE family protein [Acidobacteriia bacterium]|nr:sulfite exporter TauE/SafE family protein [Terriglobia bacterium]
MSLVFLVAVAYSSVGHGGASGYLAVLGFFGLAPAFMAPSALLLNLLVAGLAFWNYWRAGHFVWRLLWPFLLTSIPCAFLGARLNISPRVYLLLLAAVLLWSAYRLLAVASPAGEEFRLELPSLRVALPVGAAIGLLSGIVGVGGGIFLSPLMILLRWADAKRTAATSAAFIWLNSAAGLYGRLTHQPVDWLALLWLVVPAVFGGVAGSRLGAQHLQGIWLRRILAGVLVLATVKLLTSIR